MKHFDKYFFSAAPLHVCALIRIAYSFLLLVSVLFWAPDLSDLYSNQGFQSYELISELFNQELFTIFRVLPNTPSVVWIVYALLVLSLVLLIFGIRARLTALASFILFVSFANLNAFIWDGEDIVFALLGFFLIFLPTDRRYLSASSLDHSLYQAPEIWPLRLIQIQMCLIYISTTFVKTSGTTWLDGTALYYAHRMTAAAPRFPLPSLMAEWMPGIQFSTWSALFIECTIPFLLIFPKTRKIGLIFALSLHLGIEYSLNLFLFQWIMLTGLISFLSEDFAKSIFNWLTKKL